LITTQDWRNSGWTVDKKPSCRYDSLPYGIAPQQLFGVTWRHRSRDHLIPHMPFPIGGPLERSLYLQPFSRYSTSNITQWLTWPWYDL